MKYEAYKKEESYDSTKAKNIRIKLGHPALYTSSSEL